MKKNNKGFTLVELIVVLVILAILAAILVPTLLGYIDRARSEKDFSTAQTVRVAAQSVIDQAYGEGYLADVALIYAMISFVAVLMMASMFVPSKPKQPELDSIDTEQESGTAESSKGSGVEKQGEDKKR